MSTSNNTAVKADVYQKVTDAIVTAIEQGAGSWRMPWHTSGKYAFSPINAVIKKPYRGLNIVALWAVARSKRFESSSWATYGQWAGCGAQVRKGEKVATVVFWKFADDPRETDDETETTNSRLCFARAYSVFNAAQVDG